MITPFLYPYVLCYFACPNSLQHMSLTDLYAIVHIRKQTNVKRQFTALCHWVSVIKDIAKHKRDQDQLKEWCESLLAIRVCQEWCRYAKSAPMQRKIAEIVSERDKAKAKRQEGQKQLKELCMILLATRVCQEWCRHALSCSMHRRIAKLSSDRDKDRETFSEDKDRAMSMWDEELKKREEEAALEREHWRIEKEAWERENENEAFERERQNVQFESFCSAMLAEAEHTKIMQVFMLIFHIFLHAPL